MDSRQKQDNILMILWHLSADQNLTSWLMESHNEEKSYTLQGRKIYTKGVRLSLNKEVMSPHMTSFFDFVVEGRL